jgi:hypothetical protein
MSLNAWEQRALDSIKDGLTGSDPELAALLSAFTRLASGEDMPGSEKIQPGLRRALRRLRRARWRATFRRACQLLGFQRAAALLCLLTTAALMAVTLALNDGGGGHAPCLQWVAVAAVCTSPAPKHGSGPTSHDAATGQTPQQRAVGIQQAGPRVPLRHARGLTARVGRSTRLSRLCRLIQQSERVTQRRLPSG